MSVTLLHNTCEKIPYGKRFTVSVTKSKVNESKGTMYFEIGLHKVKIRVCPFCGQNASEIIKAY